MLAADNGHKEVVQLLLERGADMDIKDDVSDLLFPTVDSASPAIVTASHECSEPLVTGCGVPP